MFAIAIGCVRSSGGAARLKWTEEAVSGYQTSSEEGRPGASFFSTGLAGDPNDQKVFPFIICYVAERRYGKPISYCELRIRVFAYLEYVLYHTNETGGSS